MATTHNCLSHKKDNKSTLDSLRLRMIDGMEVQTIMGRIAGVGLSEVQRVRRQDGSRIIYFEDDAGRRFMIDDPAEFPPAKRLSLLNRFLAHNNLSQH